MVLRSKVVPEDGDEKGVTKAREVQILSANARSIKKKVDALVARLRSNRYLVVAITETWLRRTDPEVFSSAELREHEIFRKDRSRGQGGGVALLIHKHLVPIELAFETASESVWVKLEGLRVPLLIGVIYISRPNVDGCRLVCRDIEAALPLPCMPTVIFGDLNFRGVDWNAIRTDPPKNSGIRSVMEALDRRKFEQLVSGETHSRGGQLDVLLTNTPGVVADVAVGPYFGTEKHQSDHREVTCALRVEMQSTS
jgi:hypothetical protein